MATNTDNVKSAGRVLAILELFYDIRRPATAREISEQLKIPRSSTNVLIRTMVKSGYLWVNSQRLIYFPTLKVAQLGNWLYDGFHHNPKFNNVMQNLNEVTRETVTLTMQIGYEVQFIRVLDSKHVIRLNMEEGSKVSLFESAVGIAILSTRETQEIKKIVQDFKSWTKRNSHLATTKTVLQKVAKVKELGVSIAYDKILPDTGAIAIGIPNAIYGEPVAIAVGGPTSRIRKNEKAIIKLLKKHARTLSSAA